LTRAAADGKEASEISRSNRRDLDVGKCHGRVGRVGHVTSLSVTLSERVLVSLKSCALLDFLFSLQLRILVVRESTRVPELWYLCRDRKLHSIKIKFGVSVAAQATQNILMPS